MDYIASLQAHSIRRLKPIHQLNRLTGRTGNTQLNQSLVINPMPPKRYKYNHQITDKTGSRSITAKRAFDENPIPSERAFRGMAGLAVLYPSVVGLYRSDAKDALSVLCGDLNAIYGIICRYQNQKIQS